MLRLHLTCILLLAASSPAQTVGGEYLILQQWDGGSGDYHGWCVACAGDVNADGFDDIVVNARKYDGTAEVYSGADGSLIYRFVDPNDYSFGYSVDGAGDWNADGYDDIIIGTRNEDNAFIYSGADGSLLQYFNGGPGGNNFGHKLSGAGDVNADGYDDVIIAGYGDGFVFSGFDSTLLYRVPNANVVSSTGDVNMDGYDDFLVGDLGFAYGGSNGVGTALLHSGVDGSVIYQWYGEVPRGRFGRVGHAGDINNDTVPDIAIGAPGPDPHSSSHTGTGYIYSGADGTLLYRWPGEAGGNWMGNDVVGIGDIDGDGSNDVAITAPWASPNGMSSAGSVYLYSGADGSLLKRLNGETSSSLFGWSANGAGDVNADGLGDVVIGAEWALGHRGSTYVFGFKPGMTAAANEISVSAGGRVELSIDFSHHAAGYSYRVLASASGVGPIHHGVDIPLGYDRLLLRSSGGFYPGAHEGGLHGTLDLNGDAVGIIRLTAGNWPELVGRSFHLAVVAMRPGSPPEISSIAVPFSFTQ
jgi:hypothetical protein